MRQIVGLLAGFDLLQRCSQLVSGNGNT